MALAKYDSSFAYDQVLKRGIPGQVAKVVDAETGIPVEGIQDLEGRTIPALVSNSQGYLPPFQVENGPSVVQMQVGSVSYILVDYLLVGDSATAAQDAAAAAQQAASLVEAPADEVVATLVQGDTLTQTAGDARWVTNEGADNRVSQALSEEGSASAASVEVISERVTQEKIEAHPLDQFKRAYFKSIKHVLPFRFPGFSSATSLWASGGYLYPQAFQVDHVARELFVVYAGMGYQAIAVWDWDTEVFKSCFGVASNYVSEGAEILYEGGQRFLYLRTLVNSLQKFNVTSLPANLTTLSATSTVATEQGVNFTYREGLWTVTDPTATKGAYSSRGYFKTLDESFSPIGLVNFGELSVGGNPYKYQGNTVPKMQGICDAGGYYAVNMGGFQGRSVSATPYGLQGIRVFTSSGQLLVDSLIDPHAMMDILESEGLTPTRVEGEGIQVVDGKLISLLLTSSYGPGISDTEGLVFLEEFSDKPDAIDFTSAASSWATPDIDSLQVGGFPRTIDGKLYDPISGEALDSVEKIVEYMKSVNQTFFSFYSSAVSVTDVNSSPIPNGMWVTITNTNNATFFMTWTGGRHMTWQVYVSGGALVKAQIHPVVLGDDGTTYYRIRVNASGQVVAVAI